LFSEFLGLRIEEAKRTGEQHSLCAYYAIRNLVPVCDVICLPYASVLNP
jgi:hypothetical protein